METATPPRSATILFVDDEPSILAALRRLFRPQGYRVLLAESGAAGLDLLAQESVDLVVSDMRMPEMDGVQFLEAVRRHTPDALRLLLTGYADIGSTIAAINRGEIHRYIAKPWDDQDLLLAVREGLERQQLLQENRRLLALSQQHNQELQQLNAELDRRVQARTAELEQVNAMLGKAYEELHQQNLLAIKVFAGLLEQRGGSAPGYAERVGRSARQLAERLGLPAQTQEDCYVAGLLHEVGKIGLPDSLLRKPLSLMNGEEAARWRRYPLSGEAALMPLAGLQRAARLVRWHQERLDGKGFPDGLAGNALPLAVQVVGLACTFHGLQSGRLAERQHSPEQAQQALSQSGGSRYSEAVVQAFVALCREQPAAAPGDLKLRVQDLRPGMRVARDLLSPQGSLLLAAGFVFDAPVITQLQELVRREALDISLHVHLPADPSRKEAR